MRESESMTLRSNNRPVTVLDAVVASLRRAGDYNADAEVAPVAILWPDGAEQWRTVVPRLRGRLPILTLGDFDAAAGAGPAIWIRAELAKMANGDTTPIVYLPGIRKDVFRNVEDAPAAIQALLYLQYRGTMFLQPNGKDWTLAAYLQNAQHGLGVRVDAGKATQRALVGASTALVDRSIGELRHHPGGIDTEYLNTLLISDVPRRILEWINDPGLAQGALEGAAWSAFCQQLGDKYRLDPDRDGPSEAARRLGSAIAGSYWIDVWNRFAEAPAAYPGIPAMLRGAKPGESGQRGLFGSAESNYHWPQDNEEQETKLRQALLALDGEEEATARLAILDLERTHGERRACVWATLGQAPLAAALEHLATVARETAAPFPAGSVDVMRERYTASGWRVDLAALRAAGAVTQGQDREAVNTALDVTYRPWLWTTAERFQEAIASQPAHAQPQPLNAPPGTCVLFADGLRYDLAARLAETLEGAGLPATVTGAVGPLPGVTPSAKPAQSPVADLFAGGPKLNVSVTAGGAVVNQTALRKLLAAKGWAWLESGETEVRTGVANAWTELGQIDSYGHNHPDDLPRQAFAEIASIGNRVANLLATGWKQVTVVTDHGWLLLPRDMPKTQVDLPQHLTVERKGRCARLVLGATTNIQTVAWYWDDEVAIAMAPGISCFEAGKRYEHGGLSLQECVVPTIVVTRGAAPVASATIARVTWRGLRCQVEIEGDSRGLAVDIRQKAGDPASSLAKQPQAVDDGGMARILVTDDAFEESSAIVVVVDGNGNVIAQRATIVGGA